MALEDKYKSLISNEPKWLSRTKNKNFDRKSLQHVIQVLQKHGFNVDKNIKYLAKGGYSTVFVVDNKYVLKFTNEDLDIKEWTKLIGHDIPNVAKCLGVLFVGEYIHNYTHIIIQPYYPFEYIGSDYLLAFDSDVSGVIYANLNVPFGIIWTDVLRRHRIDLDNPKLKATRNLFRQMYDGMHSLHRKGLDPEDIHSGNIRFDSEGVLKIIDF